MQQNAWWIIRRYLPRELKLQKREMYKLQYLLMAKITLSSRDKKRVLMHSVILIVLSLVSSVPWLYFVRTPGPSLIYSSIVWFIVLIVGSITYCVIFIGPLYRPYVIRAMRELGYEVCLSCAHWLRNLPDETQQCPECGEPRDMVTASSEHNNA
ncbi:MAG: hypothetical protein AAF432_08200 [Planctomycetota bacterium]